MNSVKQFILWLKGEKIYGGIFFKVHLVNCVPNNIYSMKEN